MAEDLERMLLTLSADVRRFERSWERATAGVNRQSAAIEKRAQAMTKRIDAMTSTMGRGLASGLGVIAAALTTGEVLRYADAWTRAGNSLAVAGVTGRRQAALLDTLYQAAQRNGAPLEALTRLYGAAAQAQRELGASEADLIRFSEGVAVSLKVAGKSTQEASGALMQLAQALGSARVMAEEFNSINEGARPILIAVANGLDAAGGSVAKLKTLVNDGAVSNRQFFEAFLRGLPAVEAMAANATQTLAQGYTKIENALTRYIGRQDQALGASAMLSAGLNELADDFDDVADVTLKVAAVIAAALVGRAIGGMVIALGAAGVEVARLIKALVALRTAGLAAMAGTAGAAGPLGAAIGVAALVVGAFALEAQSAAQRTERLKGELRDLGLLADGAAGGAERAGEALRAMASEEIRARLAEINDELDRMQKRSWSSMFGGGPETLGDIRSSLAAITGPRQAASRQEREAARELSALVEAVVAGNMEMEDFEKRLDAIAKIKVSDRFEGILKAVRAALPYMRALAAEAERVARQSAEPVLVRRGPSEAVLAAQEFGRRSEAASFLAGELAKELRSPEQKEIDARTAELLKLAKEAGVAITEAEARAAARLEQERKADATPAKDRDPFPDGAVSTYVDNVVAAESGGNRRARNPASSATGLGQFIESTWLRLFKENFPDRAASMSRETILALRTDADISRQMIEAYARENADVLRRAGVAVNEAALHLSHFLGAGDAAKVLKAAPGTPLAGLISQASIAANPTILGGGRTVDDAIAYAERRAGGARRASGNLTADERRADSYAELIAEAERYIAMQRLEVDALGMTAQAAATLRHEQELLNAAVAAGLDLTPEQRAQLHAVAEAMAAVDVAAEQAGQRIAEVADSQQFLASGVTSVFRAMAEGGDAAEQAVNRLIESLLDASFQALLMGQGPLAALFGMVAEPGKVGGLLSLFGFDAGGYTGPGGRKEPAGVVHKGEVVWSQDDVRKAGGVGVVEALRKAGGRLPGFERGGAAGWPTLPATPRPETLAGRRDAEREPLALRGFATRDFYVRVDRLASGRAQAAKGEALKIGRDQAPNASMHFQRYGTTG